jgi:hypothetical protein
MPGHPRQPVFLGREGYRQRRLRDAARLLPVAGLVLWLIPLLWPRGTPDAPGNAALLIYVFTVWVGLILAAAALSRVLRPEEDGPPGGAGEADAGR